MKRLEFYEKLRAWRDAQGIGHTEVARILATDYGLEKASKQLVYGWEEGTYYPKAEYCAALEDLMGASWGYLYDPNPWPPSDVSHGARILAGMDPGTRKVAIRILTELREL